MQHSTLYLQEVLRYSPLVTGLAFGVLGAGTVTGGLLGARVIARLGTYRVLVGAFVLQAAATASLVALGDARDWIALFLVASFVGGVGNMLAIVAFMVTATSGLPDDEQGLATGLATMTQQIGITIGIPIMSAIATARASALGGPHTTAVLGGVRLAVLVNAVIALAGALPTAAFLRRRHAR